MQPEQKGTKLGQKTGPWTPTANPMYSLYSKFITTVYLGKLMYREVEKAP